MTTLRLTKQDRESVLTKALDDAFAKQREELSREENKLGRDCYSFLFADKVRKTAAALPSGWLREDSCLRINFRGMQTVLNIQGSVKVPSNRYNCNSLGQILDEDLNARFLSFSAKGDKFKAEKAAAAIALSALLERMTTLKQLQEGWPEGAKFYAHLKPREETKVPALQIATINQMLGLREAA